MHPLKKRLLEAESNFLESLYDLREIEAFKSTWCALAREIENEMTCRPLEDDVLTQYRATSCLVEQVSHSMMDFYEDVEAIDAAFQKDLDDIFTCWDKSGKTPPSQINAPSSRRDVSLAAKWLSQNFYNPYPSGAIRDTISQQADWSRKDVDAWFTEARKRMGWNDIRKHFFGNKRAETVEKATQFFVGQRSLDPVLSQAFVDMEMRVKELYKDPFEPSRNVNLSELSGSISLRRGIGSPCTSPNSSSDLCSLSSTSSLGSPQRCTRKRGRSDSDIEEDGDCYESQHKRSKYAARKRVVSNQIQVPSPPLSQLDIAEVSDEPARELPDQSPSLRLSSPKRRRHSTFCGLKNLKLPSPPYERNSSLQAVSTPLPSPPYSGTETSPVLELSPSVPRLDTPSPLPAPQSQPTVPLSPLSPRTEEDLLCRLLFPADIPNFSIELPCPVTCDRPTTTCGVDLTLFNPVDSQLDETVLGPSLPAKSVHTVSPSMVPVNGVDINTFSGLISQQLNDEDALGLFPLTLDHDDISVPSAQINAFSHPSEIEIGFSSLDFDISHSSQQMNDLFLGNFFDNVSIPASCAFESETAGQMAQLEALKRQKEHLQERIRSLETQIATKPPTLS